MNDKTAPKSDSKGAAIDKLLKYFWPFPYPEHMPPIQVSFSNGLPEGDHDPDHMVFVVPYSTFETAILALLAQEVNKARIDELTIIAKLRGSSKNPTHESTLIGDYLRNRLTQLERLG